MEEELFKSKVLNEEEGGTQPYQVYVPENVNENTPIIVYEHGGGGYYNDYKTLERELRENGSDAIIIRYNRDAYPSTNVLDIVEEVSGEYDVPATNFTTSGHSWGFAPAMRSTAEFVTKNPDNGPQSLIVLDGYWPGIKLSEIEESATVLGEHNVVMFTIHTAGISCNDSYYDRWAANGMTIFKIYDLSRTDHAGINRAYIDSGLLEFQAGTGVFPTVCNDMIGRETDYSRPLMPGCYTVVYIDPETGEEIPIDISGMTMEQVYEKLNLDTSSFKIKRLKSLELIPMDEHFLSSDHRKFVGIVNTILSSIKSSSCLTNSSNNTSFSSTTKVPISVGGISSGFFNSNLDLLDKIANDTQEFYKIGTSVIELDKKMKDALMDTKSITYEEF